MNLQQEWIEGKLCEKGFLQERFDEKVNDHVRTFTQKGFNEIKKMLKDPEWKTIFKAMLAKRGIPEDKHEELISRLLGEFDG